MMKPASSLKRIYDALLRSYGPQKWWPGDTPFEIMVGAILTQNTSWGNVEKAIVQLKRQGLLSVKAMQACAVEDLAQAIRPAGYFNVKARRLKNFLAFVMKEYGGDLNKMKKAPLEVLRPQLLAVNGIGPETADSILLYALDKPVFVVDAYTVRFLRRHNLIDAAHDYHDIQAMFMKAFAPDAALYNEYHALIVRLGKETCRPSPKCEACSLNRIAYALKRKCSRCHRSFLKDEKVPSGRERGLVCADCGNL